jgi:hypothetical protein
MTLWLTSLVHGSAQISHNVFYIQVNELMLIKKLKSNYCKF